MTRKKIIVMGYMGGCPIAGVIWQYVHYIVGLQQLGHDVYYVEDSARLPYDPVANTVDGNCEHAARTLHRLGERFGFARQWAFCPRYLGRQTCAGMSLAEVRRLYKEADAILNVCGAQELNDDLRESGRLVMVESDPGFIQMRVDNGDAGVADYLRAHYRLFTFGENVGTERFPVPLHGLEWLPTRQPIVTELWRTNAGPSNEAFTTVTNWSASDAINWRGKPYLWSKSPEFIKFVDAPIRADAAFELATNIPDPATRSLFARCGWRMTAPEPLSLDFDAYRRYVQQSKGEFTASKESYVSLASGWFSDRSACYLAAGRPVITQETGFTRLYGGDAGLFGFTTMEEVVAAVAKINADYARHSNAAREIASSCFEARVVLQSLLERANI